MEEFEISGAREWQIEGSGLPSRPKGSGPRGEAHLEKLERKEKHTVPRITQAQPPKGPLLPTVAGQGAAQPSGENRRSQQQQQQQQQRGPNGGGRGRAVQVNGLRNQTHAGNGKREEVVGDTPAKAAWRAGRKCNGTFRLSCPYARVKQRIIDCGKDVARNLRGDNAFFDELSKRTGAFILTPKDADREIAIWGQSEQVKTARQILIQILSVSTTTTTKKKTAQFAKIMSHSESKEGLLDLIERNDSILQQLRQKPDSAITLPETMLFLWPTDELSLEASLGPSLEHLDPLRREFGCYIYIYDEDPNYIRVDAYDHQTVIAIVSRIRAKWAELMANRHVKIKLYLVQPPATDLMRNEVEVVKLSLCESGYAYATPLLYCTPSPAAMQVQDWNDKNKLLRAKNEVRLREAVERSLHGLRFLRGHVRMRVNFGTFVLDDYRMPTDSKPRYSFEEFRSMLFHVKTKGRMVPGLGFRQKDTDLIAKCSAASDILAPYQATAKSIGDAEPLYAVNFEFEGENDALLRLEAEFGKSPASGLFEVSQRRWVNPQGEDKSRDKQPPLQIGVIDFESSDWQLEIKALEFHESDSISQSLRTFSHSIQFSRGPTDGLRGDGRRRVTFSDAARVARLIEKSAVRYRLKGTNYILEVARYDEYTRVAVPISGPPNLDINLGTVNRISEKPVTSWGASVFDQEWDNMLGQHANFGLGHSAEWSPNLNTFFPCRDDPNPSDLRAGYNQLIDLVQGIAVLLGPANGPDDTTQGKLQPGGRINEGESAVSKGPTKPRVLGNDIRSWADVVGVPATKTES